MTLLRRSSRALLLAGAILGAAAVAGAALACSCLPPGSAAAQMEGADLVIVARVAEVRRLPSTSAGPMAETRFTVARTLKGEARENWWIRHQRGDSAMCGVDFSPGDEYVVIAHRTEAGLVTGLCSRAWFPREDYERAAAEAEAGAEAEASG